MKKFLILYDCGTPRIFEDAKYNYVFRTAAHATMDNVALARYLKSRNIPVKTFNMINQDYAWGQDSRKDFMFTMEKLYPDAKPGEDLLPKFGLAHLSEAERVHLNRVWHRLDAWPDSVAGLLRLKKKLKKKKRN